jgi:hypothetical protein
MPKYWKIAPGRQAAFWRECVANQCIAINWLNHLDLAKLSVDEIQKQLETSDEGKAASARSIDAFVRDIRPRDLVFANSGKSRCKGIGVVTSDYLHPKHRKNPFRNQEYNAQVRLVDWQIDATAELPPNFFNIPTIQPVSVAQLLELKNAYITQHPKLSSTIDKLLPLDHELAPNAPTDPDFIPSDQDERIATLQTIKARQGQSAFRSALLAHFQSRCAVSDCAIVELLEAAHIHPYRGAKDHHIENGLLLRADLHTLFDLALMAIHPKTYRVLFAPHVHADPLYQPLLKKIIRFPNNQPPSTQALEARYREFLKQTNTDS